MTSKKNIVLGIGSATILILCFQNCSPAIYSSQTGSFEQSSINPDPTQPQGANDPQVPAVDPQVPAVDPRQTEQGEVKCESALIQAAIAYDSVPVSQSAPVSYGGIIPRDINAEYISRVTSASVANLNITARQIDQIGGLSVSGRLNVNAQKLDFIGSIIGGKIYLVARSIQNPTSIVGDLCIAANRIPTITGISGSMTVFGRSLNGVKASIGDIGGVIGYISLYDIDVTTVQSISSDAKLENVHLKTLQGGSGDVILTNSQIDQLGSFIGTVRLRGNSKIGNITTPSTVQVIRE